MNIKLLNEHHLEFLSLKEAAQARLSLHLSKCHIVGIHMSWLILYMSAFSSKHAQLYRRANLMHMLLEPNFCLDKVRNLWQYFASLITSYFVGGHL